MTTRDAILAAVRANQPPLAPPIPVIPLFERTSPPLLEQFQETLMSMGGKFVPALDGEGLDALVRSLFPDAAVICWATSEVRGRRALDSNADPAELADVGVFRAAFGVAETGSVWLSDEELKVNALAYLAQHFVRPTRSEAHRRQSTSCLPRHPVQDRRYAVLVTGPSATADIEGVLIHGAQGVRSLTAILVPL